MSLKTENENKVQGFSWTDPSALNPVGFTKSSYERLKGEFEQSGLSVKEFIETEMACLPYEDDGCYIVMVAPEGEGNFDNPNVDKPLKYCAASLLFKIELEDMKSAGSCS